MKTFKHAFKGIFLVIKRERNFQIHIIASIFAVTGGIFLSIDRYDWLIIIIAICAVFSMEMINSAIEYLCDHTSPNYHETIKVIKDISAGAVLITAIGALIIGLIIFIARIQIFINI